MTEQTYLATTALEEYWRKELPIVFLGDWCVRYGRRKVWSGLRHSVLAHPWKEAAAQEAAFVYIGDLYEKVLPELAGKLNRLHGIDQTVRYWRIVVGPWLFHYLGAMYDRYLVLKQALKEHPGLTTVLTPEAERQTPLDIGSFFYGLESDEYNLQIISALLRRLSPLAFPERSLGKPALQARTIARVAASAALRTMLKRIRDRAVNLLVKRTEQVFLLSPYLNIDHRWLRRGSRDRISFGDQGEGTLFQPTVRREQRAQTLALELPAGDEFAALIGQLLPLDLPVAYMEARTQLAREAARLFPEKVGAIFSAIGWYWNEPFKLWAAAQQARGTRLVGNQHGGNYGCHEHFFHEEHELAITDRYYSWGWSRSDKPSRVTPFAAGKLVDRPTIGADNNKRGIVLVACGIPRYSRRIDYLMPCHYTDYLRWQNRFVAALEPAHRQALRVRLYGQDYGWDNEQRWRDHRSDISLEKWDTTFAESLQAARLFVCDILSTTFIEALAADKPTILFWDQNIFRLRNSARPAFDGLRRAGILHDSPESAAREMEKAYQDVEQWWSEPARRQAVQAFRQQFARTDERAAEHWLAELISLNGAAA